MSNEKLDLFKTVTVFDGAGDAFRIPDHPSLQVSEYTVEVWLKMPAIPVGVGIIGKAGRCFNISVQPAGVVGHYFGIQGKEVDGGHTPQGSFASNRWHHVAITNDGTTACTYIDGYLKAQHPVAKPLVVSTAPVFVGCNQLGHPAHYFWGSMSELRMFSVARSQEQIQASMNQRLTGSEQDLVLYWPLQDGTARDLSPNENHGQPRDTGEPSVGFDNTLPIEGGTEDQAHANVLALDGKSTRVVFGEALEGLDRALTIEVWAYSRSASTVTSTLLHGSDAQGVQSLRVQVPPRNGLKWKCGLKDVITNPLSDMNQREQWTHWAFIKDSDRGKMAIYRNGTLFGEGTDKNNRVLNGIAQFVAGADDKGNGHWHGMLSELRVWEVARSVNEVRETMHRRLQGTEKDLLCYWPLDEGSEEMVYDKGPFRMHGTVEGGTWEPSSPPLLDAQGVRDHWALMVYVTPSAGQALPSHVHDPTSGTTSAYGGEPLSESGVMELLHATLEKLEPMAGTRLSIAVERTNPVTTHARVLGEHRGERILVSRGGWSRRKHEPDVQLGGLASFLVWGRRALARERIEPTKTILVILGDLLDVEDLGIATMQPKATATRAEAQEGLTGLYYTSKESRGEGGQSYVDPTIDFPSWPSTSPMNGLPATFSASWTGEVLAARDEDHTFHLESDGPVRLSVNGQLLVDRWGEQGPVKQSSSPIQLRSTEPAAIMLDYVAAGENPSIRLSWSSPSLSKQIVPAAQMRSTISKPGQLKTDATPDGRGVESITQTAPSTSTDQGSPGGASPDAEIRPTSLIDAPTDVGSPRILGTEPRARAFSRARMLADALAAARQLLELSPERPLVDLLATDDPTTSCFEVAFELRRDVDLLLATQICPPRALGPLEGIVEWLAGEAISLQDDEALASLLDVCKNDVERLIDGCKDVLRSSRAESSEQQEAFCQSVVARGYTIALLDAKSTVSVAEALDHFGATLARALSKATPAERRQIHTIVSNETSMLESSCDLHALVRAVCEQPSKTRWTYDDGLDRAAQKLQRLLEPRGRVTGLHAHLYGRTIYVPTHAKVALPAEYEALELVRSHDGWHSGWYRLLDALRRASASPTTEAARAKLAAIERMHRDIAAFESREAFPPPSSNPHLAAHALPRKQWGLLLYLPGDGPDHVVAHTRARYHEVIDLHHGSKVKNLRIAMLADFPGVPSGRGIDPAREQEGGHRIAFGGRDSILHTSVVEERRVLDSGSPELLTELVKWGITQCPAQRLVLMVAGHAVAGDTYGPFSLCHDESKGTRLTLAQFCGAVRKGLDEQGRDKLDILCLDIKGMLTLETAHELRKITRTLIGWTTEPMELDYGELVMRLDEQYEPATLMQRYQAWAAEVEGEGLSLAEHTERWHAHMFEVVQEEVFQHRMEVWNLDGIELLSSRFDVLCRLLMSNISEPMVWTALLGALECRDRKALRDHIEAARSTRRQYDRWLAELAAAAVDSKREAEVDTWVASKRKALAQVSRSLDAMTVQLEDLHAQDTELSAAVETELARYDELRYGLLGSHQGLVGDRMHDLEGFLAELRQSLEGAITSLPGTTSAIRDILSAIERIEELLGSRSLAIYCPLTSRGQNQADYLTLEFHQQVHLYALLSIVRVLTTKTPHQLWRLIALSIDHTHGTARQDLLEELTSDAVHRGDEHDLVRRTQQLQFASLAEPPSITLSIKPHDDGEGTRSSSDKRYRVQVTSTKTSTLPQGDRQMNPLSFDDTIASFEMMLVAGYENAAQWSYLQSLGESLGEDIVRELRDQLDQLRTNLKSDSPDHDVHLKLQVPPSLMRYPWELMSDGHGMLTERYAVGRQVWTNEDSVRAPTWRDDDALRVLIIGAPRALPPTEYKDLPGARAEAEAVADVFTELSYELGPTVDFRRERDLLVDTVVTRGTMRRLLRRDHPYDIVHFAGHGKFDANNPERSAWILSDGLLWAEELHNTLAWAKSPPWLVYANACEAAKSQGEKGSPYAGDVYGLATACINQGVRNYIAPLWFIDDVIGKLIAKTFYRKLVRERCTLGAAMRQARQEAKAWSTSHPKTNGTHDLSWAGMVVYGDPGSRWSDSLGRKATSPTVTTLPEAPVLIQRWSPIKQASFSWVPVAGAEYYQLEQSPTPGEPFEKLGGTLLGESTSLTIPLHMRAGASYRLLACNAAGHTASAVVKGLESLGEAVGYFKPSSAAGNNHFGWSVALSSDGNTLAVGAYGEASAAMGAGDGSPRAGAVYVFSRNRSGQWSLQARLQASDARSSDKFGWSVALSADGSTLVVGACGADGYAGQGEQPKRRTGAVYTFGRKSGQWSQHSRLEAAESDPEDEFGWSVALSSDGNTLAVGACGEASVAMGLNGEPRNNCQFFAGAAYVFGRAEGEWSQEAYVKASVYPSPNMFGASVALSGDGNTLAVGAPLEAKNAMAPANGQPGNASPGSGAAYVFGRDRRGQWSRQFHFKASNADSGDQLGISVSLSRDGSTLAVGAHQERSHATGVEGDQHDNALPYAGAVYVLGRDAMEQWSQQAYIKASNPNSGDFFGKSVVLSANGNILAVGAHQEASEAMGVNGDQANNAMPGAGAVYVFSRNKQGRWAQLSYVKASNTSPTGFFGRSVAMSADGHTLAVGAYGEDGGAMGVNGNSADDSTPNAGAVYLY